MTKRTNRVKNYIKMFVELLKLYLLNIKKKFGDEFDRKSGQSLMKSTINVGYVLITKSWLISGTRILFTSTNDTEVVAPVTKRIHNHHVWEQV